GPVCIYSEKPRDILAEIAAQISHEFQQTPIAPATLGSQPGPHTLRGQETNLHAHATEQTFNLTMLGQHITITATPAAYTFNYGDGTTRGPTTSPGAPLPENRIGEQTQTSHAYTTTGHHTITLTTHFNGHYTVNNGPTLPIADQGHITSAPLNLTVWRAITRNYAENCITNPQGTGC
uniref:PKD domain-containing protein n=3 Tax=Arthrobacter TaxID=1663 RepID=UPI001C949A78